MVSGQGIILKNFPTLIAVGLPDFGMRNFFKTAGKITFQMKDWNVTKFQTDCKKQNVTDNKCVE